MPLNLSLQIRHTLVVCALLPLAVLAGCRSANSRKLAYMQSGRQYAAEGRPREAAIQFSNAVRLDASYVEGHYELSKAYQESGSNQLAIYELGQVLQLAPENMTARLDLGALLLQTGQTQAAVEQARWVAFKEPKNAKAQALLSEAYIASGDRTNALAAARAAVALNPGRAHFHVTLGQLLSQVPATQAEAQTQFNAALSLDAKDVQARYGLASLLLQHGDLHGAEVQMQQAITLAPRSLAARTGLASIYTAAHNDAQAEATLQKAIDDLPDDPAAAPLLERFYRAAGRMDRAQTAYASLVQRHPGSLALQISYIRVLIDAGSVDRARALLDGLVKDHATEPGVTELQSYMLMRDGKSDAALQLLQSATKDDPDNAGLMKLLGDAQDSAGDVHKAVASYRTALRLDPLNLSAQTALASLAYRSGDSAGLQEVARSLLQYHPALADGYLWRGVASLHMHSNAAAITDLEEAHRRKPTDSFTQVMLGRAYAAQGNVAKAKDTLNAVLQTSPNADAVSELNRLDVQAHQPQQAVQRAQQQLARAPASSPLLDQLAQAQLAAGDTAAAATSADRAVQADRNNRSAAQTFTRIQLVRGNLDGAVDVWSRWATAHPSDPQAPAALGMLYQSAGDNNAALEFYRRSLSLQADQPEVLASIAALTADTGGNLDVALSTAQSAYRAGPVTAATGDALGWIYYRKGLPNSALEPLEKAAAADESDPTVQYHLGVVLLALGRSADAASHLRRVTELAPNTQVAAQALAKLSGKSR